ncbi:MAG: hemolysin family protein [Myxococcota bacterium]
MTLLLVYIGIALGFSFLCSILEAVLLSVTPAFVATLEETKPKLHAAVKKLKADVDRPLAAILTLNTIAHTVGAAGAGAEAAKVFGDAYLGLISAVLTLLILVFSELIPKTLGAVYWKRLVPFTAKVLPWLVRILSPFVAISRLITRAMKKEGGSHETKVSKEELAALARLGEAQGVVAPSESRVVVNLFRLGSLRVRDIMTPRTVVFALPAAKTVREVLPREGGGGEPTAMVFSRIPVYADDIDDVKGYVLKSELLLRAARDDFEATMGDLALKMMVVPDTLAVPELFDQLVAEREHIALVVDEYGGVDGIVTMEDVVETLLGLEIVDEADTAEDMRLVARRRWRMRRERMGLPDDVALESVAPAAVEEDAASAIAAAAESVVPKG